MIRPLIYHAKKRSKPLVMAMLFAAGHYRRSRLRLPGDRAVVLVYHHVTGEAEGVDGWWVPFQRGVTQKRFERQMRFLKDAMTPMALRDIAAAVRKSKPLPSKAVAVTFDDGYFDNFSVAYPVLKKYAIPATIFVSTGFIETSQTFWWDQVYSMFRDTRVAVLDCNKVASLLGVIVPTHGSYRLTTRLGRAQAADVVVSMLGSLPGQKITGGLEKLRSFLGLQPNAATDGPSMMTWSHLREMNKNGVAVESHTHNHPILASLDGKIVSEELSISKRAIEEHLVQEVEGLAYPDGRAGTYDSRIARVAKAAGFRFACTTERRRIGRGADPFSLGRMPVGNVTFPVFVANLLRAFTDG